MASALTAAAVTSTAAAAATTVAAATAAITATATAVAASTTAATARWACFAWSRFIHSQRPSFDGLTIEFGDGALSVLLRRHCDKGKSTRLAGEFVLHERHFLDRTGLRKKLLQFVFRRIEGKIAYV
jgi:hypothetical protein